MSTNKRSGFSMIELVFVIVILGVLAAVAVPRFVATRTDAQVATARSDMASAQKAIVAKVFADNIDSTQAKAPDPNNKAAGANYDKEWGDWIIEVAGLDGGRWAKPESVPQKGLGWTPNNNTNNAYVGPVGNISAGGQGGATTAGRGNCGAMLGVVGGYMVFTPNNLQGGGSTNGDFCNSLKSSYESSGGPGNKIVPLASSGTVEF